jgi:hypothetical protein
MVGCQHQKAGIEFQLVQGLRYLLQGPVFYRDIALGQVKQTHDSQRCIGRSAALGGQDDPAPSQIAHILNARLALPDENKERLRVDHPQGSDIRVIAGVVVDDRKADASDAGAGMIGTLEFTSATYYRYCALNLNLLESPSHLGPLTREERNARS